MPSLMKSHLYKTFGITLAGKFKRRRLDGIFPSIFEFAKNRFFLQKPDTDRRQDIFPNENDFVYTTEAFQTDVDKLFKF